MDKTITFTIKSKSIEDYYSNLEEFKGMLEKWSTTLEGRSYSIEENEEELDFKILAINENDKN